MNKQASVIAAIDVGTNSFHLIVASVNNRGMLMIHQREKESVRLGSSTGKDMKHLQEDAIIRGVETLKNYAKLARSSKAEIYAAATSAVREAENKFDFIDRVKTEAGIDVSVISGPEEGRLIYKDKQEHYSQNNWVEQAKYDAFSNVLKKAGLIDKFVIDR